MLKQNNRCIFPLSGLDNNQEQLLSRGVVTGLAGVMFWATHETLEHALHLTSLLTSGNSQSVVGGLESPISCTSLLPFPGVNGHLVYDDIMKSWPQVMDRLLHMLSAQPDSTPTGVPDSTRIKIALCFSAFFGHCKHAPFPCAGSVAQ